MGKVRIGLTALAVAASSLATTALTVTTAATPAAASPFTFSQDVDLPIVDQATRQSSLGVSGDACQSPIGDVNVHIVWNHTFNQDLQWQLTSPSGTTVLLLDEEGGGNDNGNVLFDDEAELLAANINATSPSGWRRPLGTLSLFDGEQAGGSWTLTVTDKRQGDTGTVLEWSLRINCFDESADLPFTSTDASPIPDNGVAVSEVNVDTCAQVTDVDVETVFQHTLMSDLRFELSHGNTTVVLWDSNLAQERGGWLTFDDESATPAQSAALTDNTQGQPWPVRGNFAPDNPLTAFDGSDGAGTWRLTVRDVAPGDVGELQQFGIRLGCIAEPPPPGDDPCAQPPVTEDGFTDVVPGDNVHEAFIDCIAFYGIAQGVDADTYDAFRNVSRAQMASFVARLIRVTGGELPDGADDAFPGDDGGVHEDAINQLAAIGVIGGNGDSGDDYNAFDDMRRDHMASFLARAYEFVLGQPLPEGPDAFPDDDGNDFEADINALAAAGIVQGSNGEYNPDGIVSRSSMGSFLAKTLQRMVADGTGANPL